jgi:hypothetical protein
VLTGPERLEWVEAFFAAFSPQEFDDLLSRLNDGIGNHASEMRPPKVAMSEVIAAYSRRDEEQRLIAAAIAIRPRNEALLKLTLRHGVPAAPTDSDNSRFERLIVETNSFLDIETWIDRADQRQMCVCRIEIELMDGDRSFGTGFLVGPDLVMTARHVLDPLDAAKTADKARAEPLAQISGIVCRFDYKVLSSGATHDGATFMLADNWRVAVGCSTPVDAAQATVESLDFAIVRLARPAGELPADGVGRTLRHRRGWIVLPPVGVRHDFRQHSPLFMIQHPKAAPLKLALESNAIQALDPKREWVRYRTNSEPGSSGSPCFDQNWNLIAMHVSGDAGCNPTYNEGIPVDTIVEYLTHHGMANAIPFEAGPQS